MLFSRKSPPAIRSLVGEGTLVRGELRFRDGLRIDGEVHGDVSAETIDGSLVVISENARVHGKVTAGHVIICGAVVGPIHAHQQLELQPKARVEGDVCYAVLEMHPGATISGELRPMQSADKPTLKLAAANQG